MKISCIETLSSLLIQILSFIRLQFQKSKRNLSNQCLTKMKLISNNPIRKLNLAYVFRNAKILVRAWKN